MGIYNNIKLFQHKETLKMIETGNGSGCVPLHVRIEPTEICNFRCVFCHWHDVKRRETLHSFDFTGNRSFNLSRLLKLIDELADIGTKALSFTGVGDPLVFPHIGRVLRKVCEREMQFGVTSNFAMHMDDALINELVKAKWIRWSMNAGKLNTYMKVHNPIAREGTKVFERAQKNIKNINEARKKKNLTPDFNASYVVCTTNQHDILHAACLAQTLGLDSISFRPDTPFEKQSGLSKYASDVVRDINKAKEELSTEKFNVYGNLERLEDIKKIGDPELVCFYSNHTTYIAANGDVYPCCFTRHHSGYIIGNIFKQHFKEFWISKKRKNNYKNLIFDSCPPCPYGITNQVLKTLYKGDKRTAEIYEYSDKADIFI